jgi:hypothetical protein
MDPTKLTQTDCGCTSEEPVKPQNQIIVAEGAHIVRPPCDTQSAPQQSALTQPNVFNPGGADNRSACSSFQLPSVQLSFNVAAINKTGSFFSDCASTWGLPGLVLFFPGFGQMQVVGVSGSSVTYKNLNIEPGTEIVTGVNFAIGIPRPANDVDEDPDIDDGNDPADQIEDTVNLDSVWGEENGIHKRILPTNGMALVGIGGQWKKRRLGQMRYAIDPTNILNITQTRANQTFTQTLPSRPTIPDGISSAAAEILVTATISQSGPEGKQSAIGIYLNDIYLMYVGEDHRVSGNSCSLTVPIGVADESVTLRTAIFGNEAGTMAIQATVMAYHY